MKNILALALLSASFNVLANSGMGYGYGMGGFGGIKFDPCVSNLNLAMSGYNMYMAHSPVSVDDKGKLVVASDKVQSFTTKGNVKTVVFKTTNPYGNQETTQQIVVTESDGKIVHVTRHEDVTAARKWQEELKAQRKDENLDVKAIGEFPIVKKTDFSFEHDKMGCKMTSTEMTMEKNSKDQVMVTHDKKFCDNIAPLMNQMGRQNALQCAGLFSQIEASFKARSKEISKDGKELVMGAMMGFMGAGPKMEATSRDWTMMSLISSCMMADNPILPGMGYGVGMGYPGMGGGYPAPGTNGGFDNKAAPTGAVIK